MPVKARPLNTTEYQEFIMAKKKRAKAAPQTDTPAPAAFNQPFGALANIKPKLATAELKKKSAPPPRPTPPPPPPPPSDDILFINEMSDVEPIKHKDKRHQKAEPLPVAWKTPELPNEDLEVLRSLSDLVTGKAEFDLTYTAEYVEGQTRGLPPTLMEQLRAGRIPYQDHLDLHGYTLTQAEAAVTRFILDSVALGRCCILLIHGRGLGSKDGVPVLKRFLEDFLLRGAARKFILAFTTARPVDGGLGASYILLRS
ncbi:DNA mismatch repair protein MutS [Deltaproteobacteria bacterium Smac51]|nr:DNA mismatch repair protein MutS [Deltaproteobacteria bacterium Smac51]